MSKLMNGYQSPQTSAFSIQGRLVDFFIKDGYKLKGLKIVTTEGQVYVKLAKSLQINFNWFVPPGTPLQLYGERKINRKTGECKFKAQRVTTVEGTNDVWANSPLIPDFPSALSKQENDKPKKAKATILVCKKSDCMKRGGKKLCQALETAVSDRGLENQVTIKGTGCMKSCKAGPNLVMPDKTRYKRIQADQVPQVLDKHFAHHNSETSSDIEIMVTETSVFVEKPQQTVEIFS